MKPLFRNSLRRKRGFGAQTIDLQSVTETGLWPIQADEKVGGVVWQK